jgi:hypothetical protein
MTMKRAILAGVMAATALAVPLPAEAGTVHVGIRFGTDYYPYDGQRIGYERGREDGWREGYADARRGRRFEYRDERCYARADAGWRPEYGPRYVYAHGYRSGFEQSYRRGYAAGSRQASCRRDHRHDGNCGSDRRWDDSDGDWRHWNDSGDRRWNDDDREDDDRR